MNKRKIHPTGRVLSVCLVLALLLVIATGLASAQMVEHRGGGFLDDFGSPMLQPGWVWVDPLGDCNYSLTDNPGHLRLYAPDGGHDLYMNLDAPRLVRPVRGDFVATTKVTINPTHNYQGAGLLIWHDQDNYVRLERTLVSGIDMWYRVAGAYGGVEIPFSGSPVFLRLQRAGDRVTAWYSEDASKWVEVSTIDFKVSGTLRVGLDLINQWQDNPIWADFDFFKLSGGAWHGVGGG